MCQTHTCTLFHTIEAVQSYGFVYVRKRPLVVALGMIHLRCHGLQYGHAPGIVRFPRTHIEFIDRFFAPNEVSEILLTFSDPQMKSENSRLSSPLFLERYRRFLKPGGIVHLKTDSRFLHEYTKAVVAANGLTLEACSADVYHDTSGLDPVVYEVQTFYEKMFLEMGLPITYLQFCIDHEGDYVHPSDFDEKFWREAEGPRRSFAHSPTRKKQDELPCTIKH